LGAPPLSREHSKRYPFRGDAFLMFKTMPDRVKTPSVGRGVAVSAGASLPPTPDAGFRSSHVGSIYAGAENRRRCYPKQAIIGSGGRDHLLRPSVGKGDSATISAPGPAPKGQGFGDAEAGALAPRWRQGHVRLQRRRSPRWHPVEQCEPRRDQNPVGLVA
jgi:hypothetical protein